MLNTCGASRDCDVIRTYLSDVNYPREGIQVKKMITGGLALATLGLAIAACGGSNGNAVGHAAGDTTQQNSAAAPSQSSSAPASGTVPGYPNVSLTGYAGQHHHPPGLVRYVLLPALRQLLRLGHRHHHRCPGNPGSDRGRRLQPVQIPFGNWWRSTPPSRALLSRTSVTPRALAARSRSPHRPQSAQWLTADIPLPRLLRR